MASVWRAEDDNLKRLVAIKLLCLAPQRDAESAVEQFLREARIAAAIQHRNVIHTMDFGTTEERVPYMVMELLHGESLAERMLRKPPLSVGEWVRIIEMTLRGLAAVHEAGIVHRDLKPHNIFLQRDADAVYPKILDFGISRSLVAQQLPSPIATQQGFVIGTPHYMAPEQASGEGQIDQRADLYSVGTILYEGLAGRLPFEAETTADLLVKILASEPVPLRELCPAGAELIADCVGQAMARDREQRFADARAFRNALQRAFELSYPALAHPNRLELSLDGTSLQAPVLDALRASAPHNDATQATWGDFEGLSGRPSAAQAARARAATAAAPAPRAAAAPAAPKPPRPSRPQADSHSASAADAAAIGQPQDGPMFGENPLDAFAGAAAMALELDYAPRQEQRRLPEALPKERKSAELRPSQTQPRVALPAATNTALWWWFFPALLTLLLCVFWVVPGLFSIAPPDQAELRMRESENAATRGSTRELRRERPTLSPAALPPARELLQ